MPRPTNWYWCSLTLVVVAAGTAAAQETGWGLGALAVARGEEPYAGIRAELLVRARQRVRLTAAGSAVTTLGSGLGAGARLEALAQFHLAPGSTAGWGAYGAGGLAYVARDGVRGGAVITVALGLEAGPGARRSAYVELGLGGGVRVVGGVRWRPALRP